MGLAAAVVILGSQLAFVAGCLGAVRAFRHRHDRVVAGSEATVIVRRAAVGLGGGLAAMAGLAALAVEFPHGVSGWWTTLALSASAIGAGALVIALPAVRSAMRCRSR